MDLVFTSNKIKYCSWLQWVIKIVLLTSKLFAYKEDTKKEFFVNTPTCKMPYVDPFTPDLLAMWYPYKFQNCSAEKDSITVSFDHQRKLYQLQINKTSPNFHQNYSCSYSKTIRIGKGPKADKIIKFGKAVNFKNDYIVPQDVNGMIIKCIDKKKKLIYTDAFSFIQYKADKIGEKNSKEQLHKNQKIDEPEPLRKPNVIMLGIDTISRINFRRNFPKLFGYFNKQGWHEMQGYNKVGDNTFPNLMAVLTGLEPMAVDRDICNTSTIGCFERLPFVWKNYKNAGYLTSYAEDMTEMNMFTYFKPGFEHQPVDYYLRPFLIGIEHHMVKRKRFQRYYCIGRRLTMSYIYDYCHQYIERYLNTTQPIFGLFWTSSFSHDIFSSASSMDQKMLDYIISYGKAGLYNDSIVFFLSDHGVRWGPLNKLAQGYLEERIPILFIWLPEWIRKKYPHIEQALTTNRNRLSSSYDLHMTLQHILQLNEAKPLLSAPNCPTCQSLFFPVPINRTCVDAGIVEHFCTCSNFKVVKKDTLILRPLPKLVVESINDYIYNSRFHKQCTNLTLLKVKQIVQKEDEKTTQQNKDVGIFRLHFIVNPKDAEFSSTVSYNMKTQRLTHAPVEIYSRLNSYNDSYCVNDKIIKKFCICRHSLNGKGKMKLSN